MSFWRVLQVADSAFPVGGFAHSGGLEAMVQTGEVAGAQGLERFATECIWQATLGALPLLSATHVDGGRIDELDALSHSILWSDVASRASRAQGRAFLDSAARIFECAPLTDLRARLARREIHGHLAPLFGVTCAALSLGLDDARSTFLHLTLRGVLSAAVRLGVVGPYESQSIQDRVAATLDRALAASRDLDVGDVAQTSPIVELVQASHDRLYSRLFQS